MAGKGDDYRTTSLPDYYYHLKQYQLICYNLSQQKELDTDPRAIQQIEFYGTLNTTLYSFRKIRRNCIRILQRNSKSVVRTYKWLNTT